MQYSSLDFHLLLGDIHKNLADFRNPNGTIHKGGSGPKYGDINKKIKKYRYPFPACCSHKDFIAWLKFTNAATGDLCICAECDGKFMAQMARCGKCNRPKKYGRGRD